jgi:hypothetical protein
VVHTGFSFFHLLTGSKKRENISKAPPPIPFIFDDFAGVRMRDQGAHTVHFICMEQIGHSMMMETFQGRARVYQSCQGHYTAVDWMKVRSTGRKKKKKKELRRDLMF